MVGDKELAFNLDMARKNAIRCAGYLGRISEDEAKYAELQERAARLAINISEIGFWMIEAKRGLELLLCPNCLMDLPDKQFKVPQNPKQKRN